MWNNDTWFDAFFRAVTSSPEFKWAVEKDWKWDMTKWLKKMQEDIKKAWEFTKFFGENFATPEAINAWNMYTTKPQNDYKWSRTCRITSYNVCYTKLLRSPSSRILVFKIFYI